VYLRDDKCMLKWLRREALSLVGNASMAVFLLSGFILCFPLTAVII
jgi:hypothetical protein